MSRNNVLTNFEELSETELNSVIGGSFAIQEGGGYSNSGFDLDWVARHWIGARH